MTQQLTVTLVVVFVGLFMLAMGLGTVWLIHDHIADSALLAIPSGLCGTALGAIAGFLASTRVSAAPEQIPPPPQPLPAP